MTKPLKPSLKFISKLPTLKIKEVVETTNMVIWEVELNEPVEILADYSTFNSTSLNTFYVEAITLEKFSQGKGWYSEMEIGITTKGKDYVKRLIYPKVEEWYLKNTWWKFSG